MLFVAMPVIFAEASLHWGSVLCNCRHLHFLCSTMATLAARLPLCWAPAFPFLPWQPLKPSASVASISASSRTLHTEVWSWADQAPTTARHCRPLPSSMALTSPTGTYRMTNTDTKVRICPMFLSGASYLHNKSLTWEQVSPINLISPYDLWPTYTTLL